MKRFLITTAILATFGGTSALAQMPPQDGKRHMAGPARHHGPNQGQKKMFEQIDADKDGIVTQDEMKAHRGQIFDKMDRNDDGYLEGEEKRLGRQKYKAKRKIHQAERKLDRKQEADTDKDGKVSYAEFATKNSPLFKRLDSNGDGNISAEEHDAAKRDRFKRMDVNGDGFLSADDRKAAKEKRQKERPARQSVDTNDDGKVSRSEFVDAEDRMFAHMDANKDGKITKDEVENAPRRHKGPHKRMPPKR